MSASSTARRAFVSGALGLLLCTAAAAGTITVDPGGSGDYLTIQEAIDNAVAGDEIVVAAGVYIEDLVIDVSVSLVGAGLGQTLVFPATSAPGSGVGSQIATTTWMAIIRADDVSIRGFSFNGDNPALPAAKDARGGIVTDYSLGTFSGIEVRNCGVRNVVYRGIYLAAGGTGHSVLNCNVTNVNDVPLDSVGIFFYGAQGVASGCVVDDCSVGLGFQAGGGGTFSTNRAMNCDLGLLANGSQVPVAFSNNILSDSDQVALEAKIRHQVDNPALGLVDFSVVEPSFTYCVGKLSSAGCIPSIGSGGICSATLPAPFDITAVDVVSQQFGFLFYGFNTNELPFWGGTLCLKGPLYRTGVQSSHGVGAGNCSGTYSYDMNALIQSGTKPQLVVGISVYAQYWFRDPFLAEQQAGLTNAITFNIAP